MLRTPYVLMMSKASETFNAAAAARRHNRQSYQQQRGSFPGRRGGIPFYVWGAVGGTATVFGLCYYAFLDVVPVTGRRRWIATSFELERQLGDQEYQQLLKQWKADILPSHHRASVTLHRVGQRIADASLEFAKRHNLSSYNDDTRPYTYTVVRSDTANAFVLPGNHVFVLTGLFRYVKDEDDLAVILGHEVAHNLARHAGEKISGSILVHLLARLSLLCDPSGLVWALFLPAASVLRELPNSRIQEREADQIGLLLAAEACYDPRAAHRVFAAMQAGDATKTASIPEFLSTHPSHDTRMGQFDQWMPQALAIVQADHGERCFALRQNMTVARHAAALEAARRGQ